MKSAKEMSCPGRAVFARAPLATKVGPRRTVKKTFRALAATAALSVLTVGTVALSASPASAATLDDVTMTVSNNATGATGATYTWNFTTKTAGTLTSLTFTVPAGTTLTTPAPTSYGLTGCTIGTPTLSSGTVTVPLTTCPSVAASTPVSIAISGFTNTNTATTAFMSTVTTLATAATVDTGTASDGVTFNANTTDVTVVVPESLSFTNANTVITLLPVPGNSTPATGAVKLTVATNAQNGYSLASCVTADITDGNNSIPQLDPTGLLDGEATAFGAQASVVSNNGSGTVGTGTATRQGAWATTTGNNYLEYAADCELLTTNATVVTNTGTTNGDDLTLTNAVSADAVQPHGEYTGTITYQLTPSY